MAKSGSAGRKYLGAVMRTLGVPLVLLSAMAWPPTLCRSSGVQGTSTTVPELPSLEIRLSELLTRELDTLLPGPVDDTTWWLTYFYRKPDITKLVPVLQGLVEKDIFTREKGLAEELVHFFATVLNDNEEILEDVRGLASTIQGPKREIMERIVAEAERFESLEPTSPESIDLLWAEFRATGEHATLEKVASVLDRELTEENLEMIVAASSSFIQNVRVHCRENYPLDNRQTANAAVRLIDASLSRLSNMADDLYTLGKNEAKFERDDKAREYYEAVLQVYPCSSRAYRQLGIDYRKGGMPDKARDYFRKALSLNPNDPSYYYHSMGYLEYREKNFDRAVEFFEKALGENPELDVSHYYLAKIFRKQKETQKALSHYAAYLRLEPNSRSAGKVREYLSSHNYPFQADPLDWAELLRTKQFDRLDEAFRKVLEEKKKNAEGLSTLSRAYRDFLNTPLQEKEMAARVVELTGWTKARPSSHFSWACLGGIYVTYAWQARGRGWASTVVEDGQQRYQERLERARKYLEKAYELNATDPFVPGRLIVVAMGQGERLDEVEKQFLRAVKADPSYYPAYLAKLTYLMPKWHGSIEEMFAFAREAAAKGPGNSMVSRILTKAHWEVSYRVNDRTGRMDYFTPPGVWEEMREVYDRLLHSFPDSLEIRNWYARTAYLAKDYKRAHQEFERIGEDWDSDCWDNRKYFLEAKENTASRSTQ